MLKSFKVPAYMYYSESLPSEVSAICPNGTDIDWTAIESLPYVAPMKECQQDARYHAEGDVWTHTKLCLEHLVANQVWQSLPERDRQIVFLATLFHDAGKPACTRVEEGSITSKGHSAIGESLIRQWLYKANTDIFAREEAASLIRFHQRPFHFLKADDIEREVIQVSYNCSCAKLHLLACADAGGRDSEANIETMEHVDMFQAYAQELECWNSPYEFPGEDKAWAKYAYFYLGRSRFACSYDSSEFEVHVLTGLPGCGKDYVAKCWFPGHPVLCLDDIRDEMGIKPGEDTSDVVRKAKSDAKWYLRERCPFVFNSTCLTRKLRREWIDFFKLYKPRISIVHIDSPAERRTERMRSRGRIVDDHVIAKMLRAWQTPGFDEGYTTEWILNP